MSDESDDGSAGPSDQPGAPGPLRVVPPTVAIGLCVIGSIWFAQGIGWLGGSFMSGDSTWTVIGIVTAVAGVTGLVWNRRSRRP